MRYDVLLERLQNLIKHKPSQKDLGDILGLRQTSISGRALRNSNFTDEEIDKINAFYGINLYLNIGKDDIKITSSEVEDEIIEIPYWEELPEELRIPDFDCVTAQRGVIKRHWGLNPESLRIVPMVGDKLTNYWYRINDSDILIIDTSHNYIMGNGVYFATSQNNTRFWIREMQNLINDDVQIKGYAPSGDTIKIFTKQQLEEVDFKLIGKVIKNVSFRL